MAYILIRIKEEHIRLFFMISRSPTLMLARVERFACEVILDNMAAKEMEF